METSLLAVADAASLSGTHTLRKDGHYLIWISMKFLYLETSLLLKKFFHILKYLRLPRLKMLSMKEINLLTMIQFSFWMTMIALMKQRKVVSTWWKKTISTLSRLKLVKILWQKTEKT